MLAACLTCTASLTAQQGTDPNRLTLALSDPNRPATVDVRVWEGDITIRVHSGNNVIVTAMGDDNDAFGTNSRARGLRRLTAGRLAVEEENNVVSIRGDRSDGPDLIIEVPARTNLKVQSQNDEIRVQGVEGDIEVTSQNESVTLNDVAGSVVVHSQNDDVHVTMTRLTPDKPMAFSSVNGNVDVTLPANVKANLNMSTVNGDIYTDFDVQINDRGLAVPSRRRGITGTINAGGPVFEVRSVNGNLYIRKGN
jgi:hypothetical protein